MTDEELDRARAEEAFRRIYGDLECGDQDGGKFTLLGNLAARLAREGWMPPDPLGAEIEKIAEWFGKEHRGIPPSTRDSWRYALERGIEIGREHRS